MSLRKVLNHRSFFLVVLLLSSFCFDLLAVDLSKFASNYHLNFSSNNSRIQLKNSKHRFSCLIGSKEAEIDGTKVYLTYPLISQQCKAGRSRFLKKIIKGKRPTSAPSICYSIDEIDQRKVLMPLLFPENIGQKLPKIIVIDPGHGGKADGAINKGLGLKEKDLTLKTSEKLAAKLKLAGYTVYLTRTKDVDISLENRSAFANSKKADLFISIHYNSALSQEANGLEVFTYPFQGHPSTDRKIQNASDRVLATINKYDNANTYLAWNIQNKMVQRLKLKDRGVRRGRMGVLRRLNCPGVLIECGFISNRHEGSLLKSEAYQNNLVQSIFEGIKAYCR